VCPLEYLERSVCHRVTFGMESRAALRQVLRVVRQSLRKGGEGDRSPMWTQYVLERFRADASETAPDPETLATRVKLLRDYTQLVGHVHAHRVRSAARAATCHAPRWPWITCALSRRPLSRECGEIVYRERPHVIGHRDRCAASPTRFAGSRNGRNPEARVLMSWP